MIIAVTLLGCYFLAIFSGFDRLICWLQPRSLIGWDILYGIALPPQIRLTQTMVTGDTDDTTFGKLFKRGYIDSTLANQAANGKPWLKRSRTSRGNCMHSASGVDVTKYRARQRC